jgi:uncharacterized protein
MEETPRPDICAIAVMAKAPQPGRAKTRLVPPLDPAGAAALGAAFLRDVTENIACAGREAPIAGCVAYAPAGQEALFDGVLAPGTRLLLADGSPPMPTRVQGFGRSLLHAMQTAFASGYGAVCLLNADSPTLPTEVLRRAAHILMAPGDRVVLGPAEDGGYYLIGAKAPHAHLFEDIDWSTDRVAAQTRARAGALGLDLVELPRWYDVDDRSALLRLLADLEAPDGSLAAYPAPATSACVRRLGLDALLAPVA